MGPYFTPETMRFLRGLNRNNDRNWFEERRPTYERAVKVPLQALVDDLNVHFAEFAPEFVRPAHKIAMRIFRDTRFSPDKRPYKSNMAAWWARRGLEKVSGAGFYLQVGPKESFVAAGVYAPERDSLLRLRRWLADHHEEYREVLGPLLGGKSKLGAMAVLEPNALTRNPKGFPAEHPASDLLRARNWGVTASLAAEAVLQADLAERIAAQFQRANALVTLLNDVLSPASSESVSRPLF